MELKKDIRYEAFIESKRVCENGKTKNFDYVFSLKIKEIKGKTFIFYKFNPTVTVKILENDGQFFLLDKINFKKNIYHFRIKKVIDDIVEAEMFSKEEIEDRRFFERFELCPEDFGYFDIFSDSKEICKNVFIENISIVGIKLNLPKIIESDELKCVEIVKMQNGEPVKIKIDVIGIKRGANHTILRGKIIDSNISIANMITKSYINIVKKIFNI